MRELVMEFYYDWRDELGCEVWVYLYPNGETESILKWCQSDETNI